MSLDDCLTSAVTQGATDRARADAARNAYWDLVAEYERIMGRSAAEAAALSDLKEATSRAARSRYHAVLNQLRAARRLQEQIGNAPDPAIALRNLLEHSAGSGYAGETVRSLAEAYTAQANAMIRDVLQSHGTNVFGSVRNKARWNNVVLEAHGRDTGDAAAKELAEAIHRAQEFLRQAFNAQGGDIGRLIDYGLPHSHDVAQLRKAGFEAWRAEIEGLLAWHRIEDVTTGKPFTNGPGSIPSRARSDRFLRDVWEGITTRGWDDRKASFSSGGRALYNQRAEHRVLHFTPEGWVAYNAKFGTSDPFSTMVNGLRGMAEDVALMRVLGPNPRAGLEFAVQVAQKRAAELAATGGAAGAKLEARVQSTAALTRAMLAHQDGSANVPGNAAWAAFFGGTRAVLTSIQLGSAILSAPTDLATISVAAKVSGLNPGNVLGRAVQLIGSSATRQTAAQMGYIAGTLADAGGAYSRYLGQTLGGGIPDRLAGFTLRASGLSFWTDQARTAFRMEFSAYLAANADRPFAQIDAPLRRLFEARGITPDDWDQLRAPELQFTAPNGSRFLTPYHWLETAAPVGSAGRQQAEALSLRLAMAIEEQLEFAVPTASLEGRARLQGATAPGTIAGELLRSTTMYKGFALSLTMNQYRRFLSLSGPWNRTSYAVAMSVGLLTLGAVAVQLKELAKGRDPRPMDEGKFWMAAFFQGGGLGIFGDFFASETNRAGGGLAETIAGPVAGFASGVIRPVASNAARAIRGEDLLLGRDAANLVRYNTPVASSLWQSRAAYDRLVADQLQRFLDPEAETAWRQSERRREREFGSRAWWDRGALLPSRAPDLSNIGGTP